MGCLSLQPVWVDAPNVNDLHNRLEKRFDAGRSTVVFNEWGQLYLVRDPERYHITHTCNHATAQWLRDLGCKTAGPTLFSNFHIVQTRQSIAAPYEQ